MPKYTADYSSSTASTPARRAQRKPNTNDTPSLASTTPIAPPPSRIFGSSQVGTNVSKLSFETRPTPQSVAPLNSRPQWNTIPPKQPQFGFSTMTQDTSASAERDEREREEDEEDEEEEEEEGDKTTFTRQSQYSQQLQRYEEPDLMRFSTHSNFKSTGRSSQRSLLRTQQYSELPGKGDQDLIPGFTRDLLAMKQEANIENDDDDIIIQTDDVLKSLSQDLIQIKDEVARETILADVAQALQNIWLGGPDRHKRNDEDLSIGPGPGASDFENARYLAILILQLYNSQRDPESEVAAMSVPEILLDWLNEYHIGYEVTYNHVIDAEPNITSSEFFWDMIQLLIARGKLNEAARWFQEADFSYAQIDNGSEVVPANYNGSQLQAIHQAVFDARQVLTQCPAVQDENWRLDSPEWIAYRRILENALDDLAESVEEDEDHAENDRQPFNTLPSLHTVKQRRGLPYDIYTRIVEIYHVLLGSTPELMAVSGDWLEASILLTVWWNRSTDNPVTQWSFDVSRAQAPTTEDIGLAAYLTRLRESFLAVTDPSLRDSLSRLNSLSPLEVGIGAVLQGDMTSAIALTQMYSLCLASALAEVGAASGWLTHSAPPSGLSQEDLMVLTSGTSTQPMVTHDDILTRYAHALVSLGALVPSDGGQAMESWQIAFSITSRLQSPSLAKSEISSYLDDLTVDSMARAERLVSVLEDLNMLTESRRVSESFGDHLINSSTHYGHALLCYARAHSEHKVRQVIDLLTSYCLVQSRAFPPDNEMDSALSSLVSEPRQAFASMSEIDPQAVETMQFYLVGYACIRRFYSLRDNQQISELAKRMACAGPLVAAVNSAADSIYGGLYDATRQSAIQVDSLLPLLGEATVLLGVSSSGDITSNRGVLTSQQLYDLLSAIEDLSTVSERVFAATDECLTAALRDYKGTATVPDPHAMLKKSMSSGTNSNFSFSMMGSEMLEKSTESMVVVGKDRKRDGLVRGWDWRQHFVRSGVDDESQGHEIIKRLRFAIARELSWAYLEESTL